MTEYAIRVLLATIPEFVDCKLDDVAIQPLAGLTNRSYKLSLASKQYVLRVPGVGTEDYIDRRQEFCNASIAAELGITPDILYFDPVSGVQLSRFVADSMALTRASLQNLATLEKVSGLLRRLHNCKRRFLGCMEAFPILDHYISLIDSESRVSIELCALRKEVEAARTVLTPSTMAWRPCHIDPTPANFLLSDRADGNCLFLLDWEYSAMSEALWDLGCLAIEANFNEAQDSALLEFYYGAATPPLMSRLTLYKILLNIVSAAWGAVQLRNNHPDEDLSTLVANRLKSARTLLDNVDFVYHVKHA